MIKALKVKVFKMFSKYFFKEASPYPLAILRIILFSFAIYFLTTSYKTSLEFLCTEWSPYGVFKILQIPCSEIAYNLIFIFGIVGSVFAILGVFYRPMAIIGAFSVMLFLGYRYNLIRMYHGYHVYVMVLFIVSLSQACNVLSLKKTKSEDLHWKYNWPIAMCKLYVVYVYFICGIEKLYFRGLDWVFSDSLYLVMFVNPQEASLKMWILDQPLWVSQALAFWSLFVCELMAPLALLNKCWGYSYWFIWLSFHMGVHITLGGHKSFFSQLVAASVFLIPLVVSENYKQK